MGLLDEFKKSQTETKEVEVVEEQPTEPQEQAVEQTTAAQTQQEADADVKNSPEEKQATPKKKKPVGKKETKKDVPAGSYKYPFGIYSEGRMIDVSSYGFVDDQVYTEEEITSIMLQHRHYEFAGTMEYSFIKDDNVLVVTGKQHRKG